MKKILVILVLCWTAISINAQEVNDSTLDSIPNPKMQIEETKPFVLTDSLLMEYLKFYESKMGMATPRFKLYKTDNIYILIKLDTATGQLWQVQYGMGNSSSRREVSIDDYPVIWDKAEQWSGRFELYPTNNMYTFIMIDTRNGNCYQVQWNTDPDKRFRIRIW